MSPDALNATGDRTLSSVPRVVRTEYQLAEAVAHVSTFDHFVVDVETDFNHPKINDVVWVGLAVPDRVVLIPMGHPVGTPLTPSYKEKRVPPPGERRILLSGKESTAKKEYKVPASYRSPGPQLRPDVVFDHLRPLFFSERTKIGHNLKFDLESISKYYGGTIPPGPYFDTLVLTHILDENLMSYSLKNLIMSWMRVPQDKDVRAKFYPNLGKSGILVEPIDKVARYLAKDVWYTLLYSRHLSRILRASPGLEATWKMEMDLYPVLMDMEMAGVRIDEQTLRDRGTELQAELDKITQDVWDICGESFDLNLPSKKRHYMFAPKSQGGQGLKPLTFTAKTKAPQLNQAVLEHYAPTNDLAAGLLQVSEKSKLISTFVTGLSERLIDGRLHTSFAQHRTVTSRLSSSNPNLQQIPRGTFIRDCFIPDDGHVFVVADYDQVELRTAAFLSGDINMVKVFLDGSDIHAEAASSMLQIPVDELTDEQRQVGKTQNFGVLYGAGPQKLADTAGVSIEQAEEFIRLYYDRFPGLLSWKADVVYQAKKRVERGGAAHPYAIIPPTGRYRRLPDLFSDDFGTRMRAERQVVNSIVQGFAATILKLALIDLHTALPTVDGRTILNVHDEVIAQVPVDRAEEGLALLVETMQNVTYDGKALIDPVPLRAKGAIAERWSEGKK